MSRDPRSDGEGIANEHNTPRDPGLAGFVGKRRATIGWMPDPNGNRGERRAYAASLRRKHPKGG
jgi:hypothetical protein